MPNRVKYGLKNVHYAVQNDQEDGSVTYEPPQKWPGAVSLSMDAQGDINKFYADDTVYFKKASNNGYEGDLETALIPDDFRVDILGEELDNNGVLNEKNDTPIKYFALMFEFDGDKSKTRHVLYNCAATRPEIASNTTEDSIEPVTETITVSNSALDNGYVHAKTTDTTDSTVYDGWYNAVYTPWATDSGETTEPAG